MKVKLCHVQRGFMLGAIASLVILVGLIGAGCKSEPPKATVPAITYQVDKDVKAEITGIKVYWSTAITGSPTLAVDVTVKNTGADKGRYQVNIKPEGTPTAASGDAVFLDPGKERTFTIVTIRGTPLPPTIQIIVGPIAG